MQTSPGMKTISGKNPRWRTRLMCNLVGDSRKLRIVLEKHVNHFWMIVVRCQVQRRLAILYTIYTRHTIIANVYRATFNRTQRQQPSLANTCVYTTSFPRYRTSTCYGRPM